MARILVAGDHPLIRAALRTLVASQGGMTVTGECSNDPQALAAAAAMRPDAVLMDLDLDARWSAAPHELARILTATNKAPVLIVSGKDHPPAIAHALQCAVMGIVFKSRPPEILTRAIHTVVAGEVWLERQTFLNMFQADTAPDVGDRSAARERLTRREMEIVELITLGLKNKQIAERLFISETTVRHHLTSIYDKVAVTSRLELMRYALREGPAAFVA